MGYKPVGVDDVTSLFPPRVMTALRSLFAAKAEAGSSGSRAAAFGDSVTATTNDYSNNSLSDSWFTYLLLSSGGRLTYAGNYAIGGQNSSQILSQMQSVFANQFLTKPFDIAFIYAGTNDSLDGSNLPTTTAANIKAMVALCRANGVRPVLVTLQPAGISGALGPSSVAPSVVATSGSLASGTYQYAYTRNNTGESLLSIASAPITLASAGGVIVTLPGDKGATYKIYRSADAGASWGLVAALGFVTGNSWSPQQSWTDTGATANGSKPSSDTTGGLIQPSVRLKLETISRWIRRYATLQKLDCIDFSSLSDGNGQWPAAWSKDGTHPTPQTSRSMGERAWDQIGHRFAPNPVQLTTDSSDPLNLVANGCFMNASGNTPSSWGGYGGSGAISRLVGPRAGFVGNVYTLIRQDATPWYDGTVITTGFSPGDRLVFSGKIETQGVEESNALVTVGAQFTGASAAPAYLGQLNLSADVRDGVFSFEDTVPSGTTALTVGYNIANAGLAGSVAPKAQVSIGQVTIYNLTTGQVVNP